MRNLKDIKVELTDKKLDLIIDMAMDLLDNELSFDDLKSSGTGKFVNKDKIVNILYQKLRSKKSTAISSNISQGKAKEPADMFEWLGQQITDDHGDFILSEKEMERIGDELTKSNQYFKALEDLEKQFAKCVDFGVENTVTDKLVNRVIRAVEKNQRPKLQVVPSTALAEHYALAKHHASAEHYALAEHHALAARHASAARHAGEEHAAEERASAARLASKKTTTRGSSSQVASEKQPEKKSRTPMSTKYEAKLISDGEKKLQNRYWEELVEA